MLHVLKRHPIPIVAQFRHVLVLTYAMPREVLSPLLPPGLTLDTCRETGFVAIGLVQTQALRPAGVPASCGQDFLLAGYRIFARFRTRNGRTLRGLRIVRSQTDRRLMSIAGNLLTHYNYQPAQVSVSESEQTLRWKVTSCDGLGDLDVSADLAAPCDTLPPQSPFVSFAEARRFAGPLPFTFDYERETNSIVVIKGTRQNWHPRAVSVEVTRNTFFEHPDFQGVKPVLALAVHVGDVAYRWERGRLEALGGQAA